MFDFVALTNKLKSLKTSYTMPRSDFVIHDLSGQYINTIENVIEYVRNFQCGDVNNAHIFPIEIESPANHAILDVGYLLYPKGQNNQPIYFSHNMHFDYPAAWENIIPQNRFIKTFMPEKNNHLAYMTYYSLVRLFGDQRVDPIAGLSLDTIENDIAAKTFAETIIDARHTVAQAAGLDIINLDTVTVKSPKTDQKENQRFPTLEKLVEQEKEEDLITVPTPKILINDAVDNIYLLFWPAPTNIDLNKITDKLTEIKSGINIVARQACALNRALDAITHVNNLGYPKKELNTFQAYWYKKYDRVLSPLQHEHIKLLQQALLQLITDDRNNDMLKQVVTHDDFWLRSISTNNYTTTNIASQIDGCYKTPGIMASLGCGGNT